MVDAFVLDGISQEATVRQVRSLEKAWIYTKSENSLGLEVRNRERRREDCEDVVILRVANKSSAEFASTSVRT